MKPLKSYSVTCVLSLLILSGCQSLQPTQKGELSLQDSEFMGLWNTYQQCMTNQNLTQMQEYMAQLSEAPRPISIQHSPIPLPKFLVNLTSKRSSRLAVDPRAMTASCALQAGQTAWNAGDHILAQDILHSIVEQYPEAEYSYYVSEARAVISQTPSLRRVSLPD